MHLASAFKLLQLKLASFFPLLFLLDRMDDVYGNRLLTLDPNVTGVFNGPYPFGIDPVSTDTRSKQSSPHSAVNYSPQRD